MGFGKATHLAEEPSYEVSENDGLVCLSIRSWRRNSGTSPQIRFPFIHPFVASTSVDEQYSRGTFDEPSSVHHLDTTILHGLDGIFERSRLWIYRFNLDSGLQEVSFSGPKCLANMENILSSC